MYWRSFEFVDELPEVGERAFCYILPDNSWNEYIVHTKTWKVVAGPSENDEFSNILRKTK